MRLFGKVKRETVLKFLASEYADMRKSARDYRRDEDWEIVSRYLAIAAEIRFIIACLRDDTM